MKHLFILLLGLGLFACQPSNQSTPEGDNPSDSITAAGTIRDGAFIHISHGSDDPHRLLMGLSMARRMAEDKDVLVYMDIEAVKVLTASASPIAMEPFGSHLEILQGLLDAEVTVMACPACLQVAGISPDLLIPGIRLAEKEAFFGFTEGRIISIDY
ncbi:MAG TPA: hypothetical protein P5550_05475 [Bacteroidales bacterium]|nr:hypothetical protein [Bacteroidales bacterium]HRZ77876.1 hypothetical protein [Bacteroidales bacterium]